MVLGLCSSKLSVKSQFDQLTYTSPFWHGYLKSKEINFLTTASQKTPLKISPEFIYLVAQFMLTFSKINRR